MTAFISILTVTLRDCYVFHSVWEYSIEVAAVLCRNEALTAGGIHCISAPPARKDESDAYMLADSAAACGSVDQPEQKDSTGKRSEKGPEYPIGCAL